MRTSLRTLLKHRARQLAHRVLQRPQWRRWPRAAHGPQGDVEHREKLAQHLCWGCGHPRESHAKVPSWRAIGGHLGRPTFRNECREPGCLNRWSGQPCRGFSSPPHRQHPNT